MIAIAKEINSVDETYEKVRRLIESICQWFYQTKGGDYSEYESAANLAFWSAYKNFDSSRGVQFSSYLTVCVKRRLFSLVKRECRVNGRFQGSIDHLPTTNPGINMVDLMDEMSEDAKFVFDLIKDTPDVLMESIRLNGGGWRNWKNALREYLRDNGFRFTQTENVLKEITGLIQ